jgi:hypothetical protein
MFPGDANRAERLSQRVQRLTLAVLLLLSANVARAHDFWIEASTFHPWPGQFVMVGLRVGQDFVGEPVRRYSPDIAAFFVRQNGADVAIEGADGITPAGILRAAGQATEVIGYASTGTAIELPPDQFEDYLRLYGLEAALADRIERGEHAKPGRERFYRYAKTLLAGQKTTASASKALGLAYEIVPVMTRPHGLCRSVDISSMTANRSPALWWRRCCTASPQPDSKPTAMRRAPFRSRCRAPGCG